MNTSELHTAPEFHTMEDGRLIAFRFHPGTGPALVFLPGYMSDMEGGKANAVMDWARDRGRACLLLDYSGCGKSSGDFADGMLSRWAEEVLTLIDAKRIRSVVLTGSSMGGWLMLIVGLQLGDRLAGMVGIAAAPDFSDWGYSQKQKSQLSAGQTIFEANPYGPESTPTHAAFWQDAERLKQLGRPIAITCPVRLIHGQRDSNVPWQISLSLAEDLCSDNIQLTLVKDGDHRLSRDVDIALLLRIIETMGETA